MQLTRILCPTDFSAEADRAIDYAVAMATWYQAGITALHVINPIFFAVDGITTRTDKAPDQLAVERYRRRLADRFAGAVAGLDTAVRCGQPAARILAEADDARADLIVMGTHGAGGFEHLLLGSVTEKVLRRANCPVLTVPPRAQAKAKLPFERLLCAVDFSEASLAAVDRAASLAQQTGARVTLLHAVEWPWPEPPGPPLDEMPPEQGFALGEYRRYVEERANARLASVIPPTLSSTQVATRVANGKAYLRILGLAAEEHADLIVIGVRGRSPVDMALFGSTANHIVRAATCPVLTVR